MPKPVTTVTATVLTVIEADANTQLAAREDDCPTVALLDGACHAPRGRPSLRRRQLGQASNFMKERLVRH